ncbi:MAG: PBECR4 domain-containing protein [Lachnospiraceae bacterium]
MTKREERKAIVDKIVEFARDYSEHLLGNTFMFVFDNRYIEVSFRKSDFAHLTGVDKHLSANDFYKEAKRGTLRENQIRFSSRHPYDLCLKKVVHMEDLARAFYSDGIVLEDVGTDTALYKFGFTELNFTLCFGEDLDKDGNKRSAYFIPKSLRSGDCFERSDNVYEIDFIFRKKNNQRIYNEMLFQGNKEIKSIPHMISEMLDEPLNIV